LKKSIVRVINILFLLLGVALIVVLVTRLDSAEVVRRMLQVGWYFVLGAVFSAAGMVVSAAAWKLLVNPRESRASFGRFISAHWAANAAGQMSAGLGIPEVVRGVILKGRVEGEELAASIIVHSLLNKFVIGIFIMLGPVLCLIMLDLPAEVILVLFGLAVAFFLPVLLLYFLFRWGVASRFMRLLTRLPFLRLTDPDDLIARARKVDQRIKSTRNRSPRRFWSAVGLLLVVRITAAAEIFCLLVPLLPGQTTGFIILLALLTSTATQLIEWTAGFVPGQMGLIEGGNAALYNLLRLDPIIGLSMALLRRVRVLIFFGIGLVLGLGSGYKRSGQTPPAL
jgi:hypothetical protein